MDRGKEEALEIEKLRQQERLDEKLWLKERLDEDERKKMRKKMKDRHLHTEKRKRHMLGDDMEEQKSKEAFHGGSRWGSWDPPVLPTKGKEVDIEHKDERLSLSNWKSDDCLVLFCTEEQKGKDDFDITESLDQKLIESFLGDSDWLPLDIPQEVNIEHEHKELHFEFEEEEKEEEEEELMDAKHLVDVEDLEAEDEQELNAFYGGSNSVSLGQLVIRDQLHAPPSPHGMSTPKILYLCFGEYMAGNKTLYSIQALCLHSFPPVQTLKAKELAYIRGEGLPLRMGCGLFGSNIVFLGGVESRFDCYSGDFTTYPRKDIYTFDTKHPYTCEVFNNSSLRQGKSRPFLVQYYDKLYVLSILTLSLCDGSNFRPAFEMFDLKQGKWATLPAPVAGSRFISHVVVGSCIFVNATFGHVLCFDMADPSPKWRVHNFTNCSALP